MRRDELGDLMVFLAVTEERSFTRASARLATSQSSLSAVVRRLEERLDLRLLTRTTRSVTPTEAGQQLADTLRIAFDDIEARLASLDEMRCRPAGNIRITASKTIAQNVLMPAADRLMAEHPHVHVEISVDVRLVDIVKEGYDAGVRLGEQIDKDMIAVRISPDMPMIVAAAPGYFQDREIPRSVQDLTQHACINLRLPTLGGLYAWEFERDGRTVNVRVDGQFICNDADIAIDAALRGRGLVCLPSDHLEAHVREGRLVQVLADWCPAFPGYHLYYPSHRQVSPAFRLFVDSLRFRG